MPIAPYALTGMTEKYVDRRQVGSQPCRQNYVAPVVSWLVSEACPAERRDACGRRRQGSARLSESKGQVVDFGTDPAK